VRGSIRTKVKGKRYEIRVALGLDPKTGRYRQKSLTVRGSRAEAERALRHLLEEVEAGAHEEKEGGGRSAERAASSGPRCSADAGPWPGRPDYPGMGSRRQLDAGRHLAHVLLSTRLEVRPRLASPSPRGATGSRTRRPDRAAERPRRWGASHGRDAPRRDGPRRGLGASASDTLQQHLTYGAWSGQRSASSSTAVLA
jgi:hypothetical protein